MKYIFLLLELIGLTVVIGLFCTKYYPILIVKNKSLKNTLIFIFGSVLVLIGIIHFFYKVKKTFMV